MELPVVIFVSAITGAISSVIVQVLFHKFSVPSNPPAQKNPIQDQDSQIPILKVPQKTESPPPVDEPEEEPEDQDEGEILTLSDVSHPAPKLGRFKDLNIPSIDDDSIQVSDVQIPSAENSEIEAPAPEELVSPTKPTANNKSLELEPTTVPEHGDIDDDETVLVQRTPPK